MEATGGSSPDGDESSDKMRNLLKALLVTPEGELDDTHFDKLQSRLLSFCVPPFLSTFLEVGALSTVQSGVKSGDYRIVSVCWRLLGKLCSNIDLMDKLMRSVEYAPLFQSAFEDAAASSEKLEPLQKDSALHCLHDIAKIPSGRTWLISLKHPATVVDTIFQSMQHPSQFVSRSAIRLLVILIKKGGGSLLSQLEEMGMLQSLAAFLPLPHPESTPQGDQSVTVAEESKHYMIDLIISFIKNASSRRFLHQQRLIWRAFPYLFDMDRLIRSNFIEVLQIISEKRYHYLMLSTGEDNEAAEFESSKLVSKLFGQLFYSGGIHDTHETLFPAYENRTPLQQKADLITAVDLLASLRWFHQESREVIGSRWKELSDVMVCLLGWQNKPETGFDSTHESMATTMADFIQKGCKSAFTLSFVTFLSKHCILQAEQTAPTWDIGFWLKGLISVLQEEAFEDPRVVKRILDALVHASPQFCVEQFERYRSSSEDSNQWDAYTTLIELTEHTTDRAIVASILNLLKKLLASSKELQDQLLIVREQTFGLHLLRVMQNLLVDWNWELREAAVSFLGDFFAPCGAQPIMTVFGLKHNVHQLFMNKLEDGESYVRASALTALVGVCASEAGWNALHSVKENFPDHCISFFVDSEAFVKREAVLLVRSWLYHQHGLNCLRELSTSETVRHNMRLIMTDFDWEVKLKGVSLFSLLWEKIAQESDPWQDNIYWHIFFSLHGDKLLVEALKDYERLVRLGVATLLKEIQSVATRGSHNKRKSDQAEDGQSHTSSEQETEEGDMGEPARKRVKKEEDMKWDDGELIVPEKMTDGEGKEEEKQGHKERLAQFMSWVAGLDLGSVIVESDDVYEEDEYLIRHAAVGEDEKTVLDCPF